MKFGLISGFYISSYTYTCVLVYGKHQLDLKLILRALQRLGDLVAAALRQIDDTRLRFGGGAGRGDGGGRGAGQLQADRRSG